MTKYLSLCVSSLLAAFILFVPAKAEEKTAGSEKTGTLKIGVRALKGIEDAEKTWGKTIAVLNNKIKDYRFVLVPLLGFHDMRVAVKNKQIDFIITNPLAYIDLNIKYGATRILTLNKKQPDGSTSTTFAAVIFTRADRSDINGLKDLRNKSIMGVHEEAFGGWRMAWRELLHHDFDPYKDSSEILFSKSNTHQEVVHSVLAGDVDVGTVRTGILEQLALEGKIKLDSVKLVHTHNDESSVLHSTEHYPEWPFAVIPHVKSDVTTKVFHALLSIKPDSAAAVSGKYVNWVAPLDYSEVYKLSDELAQQYISGAKIWNEYWLAIVLILFFIVAMIFYTLYLFSLNKKLMLSEAELSEHRDHLEELVHARTQELEKEKTRANNANQAKSDFLSSMSHELRTPLNAILGFSQLLQLDEAGNKKVIDHSNEIISAGNFLLSLINEILDLAAIEAGKSKLYLEEVLCHDILQESVSFISPMLEEKNVTINIHNECNCFIKADRKRLQQICMNLLSNAVKYNKQNGEINITVEIISDDVCKINIKDSGVGMKPEFQEKIFQAFSRAAENADSVEGTGIGLVITKKLVEQMQGNIGFNSIYGSGTEFWITMPFERMAS